MLPSSAPSTIATYQAARTDAAASALLAGDRGAWSAAEQIVWGPPAYRTTFGALWDADALSFRFDCLDPDPWHTMTDRDAHLWEEEVVEIFLDPGRAGRHYAEIEISPANIVCDVHMIAPSPDRQSDLAWDLEGLETGVTIDRDEAGRTLGWMAVGRAPWRGFASLPSASRVSLPPRSGDRWRFNVFRIKRPGGSRDPERGAIYSAWSPPPGPSFHAPAAFRDFLFRG
jgi:hypothetical protein